MSDKVSAASIVTVKSLSSELKVSVPEPTVSEEEKPLAEVSLFVASNANRDKPRLSALLPSLISSTVTLMALATPVSLLLSTKCCPEASVIMVAETDLLSPLSLMASRISLKVAVAETLTLKLLLPDSMVKVPSPPASVSVMAPDINL